MSNYKVVGSAETVVPDDAKIIYQLVESQHIELMFCSQEIAQKIAELISLEKIEKRYELGAECIEIIQKMNGILKEMKQTFSENKQLLKIFALGKKRISENDVNIHEENVFKFKKKFIEILMNNGTYEGRYVEEVFNILKKRVEKDKEEIQKIEPFVIVRNIETGLDEKIYLN